MNGHNGRADRPAPRSDDDAPTGQLGEQIDAWKRAAPAPPPELEARIRGAVAAELASRSHTEPAPTPRARTLPPVDAPRLRPAGRTAAWARRTAGHVPVRWAAAAALVLVAAAALTLGGVLPWNRAHAPRHILLADALHAAERAERDHAAAIAQLEVAALPILARADDPQLPPAQVAKLLSYRDRLRAVDSAIAEIHGILEQNAGHAGARTYLLAAYMDKTQLLRDVLALQLPAQPVQEG
jgi:hypothetical protein